LSYGSSRSFWLACAAAYLAIAALYWPTVCLAPISLDDSSQLQQLSQAPFAAVFDYDRFGHLRPIKSALFWVLSRHIEWLAVWRSILLGIVLASAALGQALCAPLLKSRGWALVAAICWVSNPITASVVCWLSTANIAICLLGILGYLYLIERAVTPGAAPRNAAIHSIGAIASLLCASLSYELGVVAPWLWLVYRRCCASPTANRRRSLMLAAASAICIAGWVSLRVTHDLPPIDYRPADHTRAQLVLDAPRHLFENLRLWFWLPGRFGVLLADPPPNPMLAAAFGWLVLVAAFALWWWQRGRDRPLDFALIWCASLLLPLMNLVPIGNTAVAMHYLYVAGFGLALGVTRIVQRLTDAFRRRGWRRAAWLPALALSALLAAWLPEQRRTLMAWQTAQTLYSATILNYPGNVEARVNLAALYLDQKQYVEAGTLLEAASQLAPNDLGVVTNRLKLLAETGKAEEALALLAAHPELKTPAALIERGLLLTRVGRTPEAVEALSRALEIAVQPEDRFAAGYQLAIALVQAQHYAQATLLIDRLLTEFPDRPELLFSKRLLTGTR
jgi:tetratricopeptide (TPR) repeat protein